MMKKVFLYFFILTLLSGAVFAAEYRVVDGDSLESGERRIRLDGIDAPEFVQNCYDATDASYPCGLEALKYLENLIQDSEVQCDCLPEPDIYGREMCECFADDVSLNRAMVFGGYAVTYRSDRYAAAEQNAKEAKRGIWQGRFMRPALFRALERIKTNPAE